MTSANDVLLDQVLRPSPPLSPRVLLRILIAVALLNLAFALFFLLRGAWPIAPFMGLDVLALGWAFRASTVAAQREEHVTLTARGLPEPIVVPRSAFRILESNSR